MTQKATTSEPRQAPPPKTTKRPWEHLGFSRSAWYRLLSADLAPKPLDLPNCGNVWRTADLDAWLAKQKPARSVRRRTPAAVVEPRVADAGA